MLPFDKRPWAPQLAKFVIAFTILAEVVATLWLRHYSPLDTGEVVALFLILVAVIPPNVHIIRKRSGQPLEDRAASSLPLTKQNSPANRST